MPTPRASAVGPSRPPSVPAESPSVHRRSMIVPAAITLIVAQLILRGWLVATGNFYWDDLILIGRASTMPILSWDYLGHSHDGHFMPAAFLVAGIATVLAPVNWVAPAITLLLLQAIASVCVWRMIRVITTPRVGRPRSGLAQAAALGALAFYLFTPMTVPSFVWWSAGLNTLPMQAAMAWIVADAVLLARGRCDPRQVRLIVIRSSVIFVIALAFFEKSLFILPVAVVAAALVSRHGRGGSSPDDSASTERTHDDGNNHYGDDVSVAGGAPDDGSIDTKSVGTATADAAGSTEIRTGPLGAAVVAGRRLWTPLGVIFLVWVVVFFSVSDVTAGVHSASQTAQLIWRSIARGVIPALVGGPWEWERWVPSPPMGFSAGWMIVLGWVLVAAIVVWAIRYRVGAVAVIVCTALYIVAAQIPVMWNRSSANTALELAQTLRYLPDAAVVITIAVALLIVAPARSARDVDRAPARHAASGAGSPRGRSTVLGVGAGILAVAAFASSLISTASYQSAWTDDPTGKYLANATRALADNRANTMFDQALPFDVLLPVAYPYNQISATFGRIADRSPFGNTTDKLAVLDDAGNLVPGAVTPRRTVLAGSGTCARPELREPTRLRLDGPLLQWKWTVALSYCANTSGEVEMALAGGSAVRVPLRAGLHVLYVQLDGHGSEIEITARTPGLAVHTGEGRVGEVVEATLLGG